MNLFDLTLRLKGFPIADAEKHLHEIQAIPEKDYSTYIQKTKKELVAYHLQHNDFYRKFAGSTQTAEWESLPVMQKTDLQHPLAERLSSGFNKKNVYVNKTSGSSGHPFIFAKDKMCHALTWAVFKNRYEWLGLNLNTSYQARFYGIPLDTPGYTKERLKDALSSRYRFPVFDLSEEKMESFFKKFKKTKFDYINGYTSSIVLFAKYLQKQDMVLKDVCPTLKVCIVTSEMLFEEDKKLLERQMGIPIVNEYGASELGLIAFTDFKDQFIVNSETLFVEILDEDDRVLPNGKKGRIVVTSLYNMAHPFIRFDIGDSGCLSPESTAKTPILTQLTGRTNDIAELPGGKKVPGLTFYYVTKTIIEENGNVKEFVINQLDLDHFEIIYVSDRELTTSEETLVKNAMKTYLQDGLHINLKRTKILDRSKRGKLKQFNRLF